jgi:hypothetical protein
MGSSDLDALPEGLQPLLFPENCKNSIKFNGNKAIPITHEEHFRAPVHN